MSKHLDRRVTYGLAVLLGISLIGGGYLLYSLLNYKDALEQKTVEQQQTTIELDATKLALTSAEEQVRLLSVELSETKEELDDTEDDLRKEKNKNDDFEDQIENLAGTVGQLDKLSKTDKELLQKYSKVYFLNENYIPSKIRQIDADYVLPGKDAMFFHADALEFLEDMIEEAENDGIDLKVVSAYRSFDHQQELKGQYSTVYGTGANTFSADQGYSEHQLGTTVDLTDSVTGGTYTSFAQTEAYQWLLENAYKYGFTLSYPEDNTFYIFEPWHWRFVGVDLAKDLDRAGNHFYDWEQREIDKYLISIFD